MQSYQVEKRMKKLQFLILGLGMCVSVPFLNAQQKDDYKLVWSEEFNAPGVPDEKIWDYEHGFVRNQEVQWYQKGNAICEDGLLKIIGKRERVRNPHYVPGSNDWRKNREYAEYTSSCLTTSKSHSWLYGRFEIRARINGQKGSWPAIWLLGVDREWPQNGEIDIMEYYLVDTVPTILANTAWGTDRRYTAAWNSKRIPLAHFTEKNPRWLSQFHVWRMDWTKEYIRIYLDNELLNDIDLSKTTNADGFNPFRQPQYLLLNLALGGNGGVPSRSDFPLLYEVDYVRVYQK